MNCLLHTPLDRPSPHTLTRGGVAAAGLAVAEAVGLGDRVAAAGVFVEGGGEAGLEEAEAALAAAEEDGRAHG